MRQIVFFFLFIFFYSKNIHSQNFTNKEIGLISDNDLYTSTYKDRYYTNGTFIYFRFLAKTSKKPIKRIREFSLGQKMYTPTPAFSDFPELQDHPFAGYSFLKFKTQDFYKKNHAIKYGVEIGTIGPNSKAQEFQEFIHNIYGFEKAVGWTYQIKNAFALNFDFEYLKPLTKKENSKIDFFSQTNISAGTIQTEITTNLTGRINLSKKILKPFFNSILFESNLSNNKNDAKEFFLFLKPKIGYAVYNATIQGSFLNKTSPVTFRLNPLILEFETGIYYALKRWNFKYSANFYKKKHSEMENPYQTYGSILVSYKFN